MKIAPLLVVACLSVASRAHADVRTVGPAGQYPDLQSAIDAANDGDVLLVAPGAGGTFTVDGKSLVIAGDGNGTVKGSFGTFAIRNLGSAQSVVLRNFEQTPSIGFGPTPTCRIEQCAGSVFVEDCVLVDGDPTLLVHASSAVELARCTVRGFEFTPVTSTSSGAAVEAVDAALHVQSSTLQGADGKDGVNFSVQAPHPGEPGLRVSGTSLVTAVGAVLIGGDGGDGAWAHIGGCINGEVGGAAIELHDASTAYVRDCALQAGAGGAGTSACLPGSSGLPIDGPVGSWTLSSATSYRMTSTSPLREGQTGMLDITGGASALFFLFASPAPAPLFSAGFGGTWVPSLPLVSLGALPLPGGYGAVNISIGELGPLVQAAALYVQGVRIDGATLSAYVSSATHVLLLDAAY